MNLLDESAPMSKSILSYRLTIHGLIEQLDEQGCAVVMRSLYHINHFDLGNLHDWLTKRIFSLTDTTIESLKEMESITANTIAKLATSGNNRDTSDTGSGKERNTGSDCDYEINTKIEHVHYITRNIYIATNLIQLPIDLILKLSLYLNEKDIFKFEKCCRIFYQIINNLSYLIQSNTFKTFTVTPKRLDQMIQSQYSFYKYCKARIVRFQDFSDNTPKIKSKWKKALKIGSDGDEWIITMFKSIKELDFRDNHFYSSENSSLQLLNRLPMTILFDPVQSNLESINIRHRYRGRPEYKWTTNIIKFVDQYVKTKRRFKNQGKRIKVLKCIKQETHMHIKNGSFVNQLFRIESQQIVVKNINIDANELMKNSKQRLRVITFEKYTCLQWHEGFHLLNNIHKQLHIETLRFINISHNQNFKFFKIFNNEEMIESLNFHNSVKNMTLNMTISDTIDCYEWKKVLLNLLTKKYYFNLENLNILLFFDVSPHGIFLNLTDWIFDIVKENYQSIKYQFTQLNIAFKINTWYLINIAQYHILKLNDKMNKQSLRKYQKTCQHPRRSPDHLKHQANAAKYNEWVNQWVN